MNAYKLFFVIPVVFFKFSFLYPSQGPKTIQDRVKKALPIDLFRTIEGAKVAAFSKDNMIRAGLDDKDLKKWQDLTDATYQLVQESNDKKAQQDLASLSLAYKFIKAAISKLHQLYGSLYKREEGTDAIILSVKDKVFEEDDVDYLTTVLSKSNYFIAQLEKINKNAMKIILESAAMPAEWSDQLYTTQIVTKNKKIINVDKIFPGYKKFLDDYQSKQNFDLFLHEKGITTKTKAEELIGKIEKALFIMQEKMRAKIKDDAREKNMNMLQDIMAKIRSKFPDIISPLEALKFNSTQDKIAMIVFAQSGALESVVRQIAREVTALLNVVQNKK